MKKFGIQVIILVLVIFGAIYVSFNQSLVGRWFPVTTSSAATLLRINSTEISVEVADTPEERSQGLSGREKLASNSGMLFVFPEVNKYQFWMKGMKFSLDFIFIREGKVVDLLANIAPPSPDQQDNTLPIYEPTEPIDMLLEVESGFISSKGIKVDDQVFLVK